MIPQKLAKPQNVMTNTNLHLVKLERKNVETIYESPFFPSTFYESMATKEHNIGQYINTWVGFFFTDNLSTTFSLGHVYEYLLRLLTTQ
jgi:hypothetical protein